MLFFDLFTHTKMHCFKVNYLLMETEDNRNKREILKEGRMFQKEF